MGKLITARKTVLIDAVLITSDEEEKVVRGWLADLMDGSTETADSVDLQELIDSRTWFMRDHGSKIVYITSPADFLVNFEEVGEEEIKGEDYGFTF